MTRYPKNGKGRRWTTLELKAIKADWQDDRLSDGDGLTGTVRVTADGAVSVRFQYIFKWLGKSKWHQCGTWPTLSLEAIRQQRDTARAWVKAGINPNDQKRADRIEAQAKVEAIIKEADRESTENLTFSAMFETWLANGVSRADGNEELRRAFSKDILPAVGSKPVRAITEGDLLLALRGVGRVRGSGRAAEVLLADLRQLFHWAEKRQPWRALLVEGNPAELVELKQIVDANYSDEPRERTLSRQEIVELKDLFSEMESEYRAAKDRRSAPRPVLRETQIALWLCLATTCRIGELLKSRWEDINLTEAEWFVPAQNTKTKVKWLVYLSPFALRQFKELQALTGDSPWCFPARNKPDEHVCLKSISKQVGDRQSRFKKRTKQLKHRRQDDTLVLGNGENGEWTPHDLRRTGATIMQRLGVALEVVDRCQNHVLAGGKIRRTYQRHDYAEEMRDAWSRLGAELDTILKLADANA